MKQINEVIDEYNEVLKKINELNVRAIELENEMNRRWDEVKRLNEKNKNGKKSK